jgi:replicative DNA helicase
MVGPSVVYAHDVADKLRELQKCPTTKKGLSTGFVNLDDLFLLQPGHLMTITGIPGMGKSEVLDCLLVNCAILHGFTTVYYSPENYPIGEICRHTTLQDVYRTT